MKNLLPSIHIFFFCQNQMINECVLNSLAKITKAYDKEELILSYRILQLIYLSILLPHGLEVFCQLLGM